MASADPILVFNTFIILYLTDWEYLTPSALILDHIFRNMQTWQVQLGRQQDL